MKKLLSIVSILLLTVSLNAQENFKQEMSPNGIFDEVFDRFGNKYSLEELRINTGLDSNNVQKSALLCSSGYFDLYFEVNSGMDGSSPIEVARRNVICQLFTDLSQFIVPANPSVKVNIWVRDISNIISSPATSGVLGLASGFYTVPSNATTYSGIVDNEIWKTINSGTNSYTNVASPLITSGGPSTHFYHGVVAFNFSNPSINWHTNLTQTTLAGLYDMYSVALHEATHALGFASLIDDSGISQLGINFPYYSRYDLFLKTATNQPLITNTGTCSSYNFGFNPSLNPNVMIPSSFNCSTHIQFGGSVNQAAYSPSVFSTQSSLSHLEDICHAPNPFPDNEYYVMSDANGTGLTFMKRYLKTEERNVLCDIGYTVNTNYGNASNLNFFNYGGAVCPGIQVAGINDGIDISGTYTYVLNVGMTIPVNGILSNDYNAVSFECLQDIYGNGTISSTSGTTFNYTATTSGIALLRYIPVSISGQRGNITYIFIVVQPMGGACNFNTCNLIPNGDFESTTSNCGRMFTTRLNCWSIYSNSPDLYGRNCNDGAFDIPGGFNAPLSDTWNNGANNNNHYLGMFEWTNGPWGEAIQVPLSTGLITGNTYQLKFWARVPNNYQPTTAPFTLSIVASSAPIQIAGSNFNSTAFGLTPVIPSIVIPDNNQWNYIVQNFTYTGLNGLGNFIIGADPLVIPTANVARYILLDDIELIPAVSAASFMPPSIVCINQILPDLSLFVTPPGGVFTGNGVTLNAGIYSFNPSLAGAGNHTITYTYTSNTGCVYDISATVTVVNANINLATTATQPTICTGETSTLTASGASSYVWNPGNFSGNPYNVTPTTTTTYTVTGTDVNGCSATSSVTVTVTPACCPFAPGGVGATVTVPTTGMTIPGGTTYINRNFTVNGDLTIAGNVTLRGCDMHMGTGVRIIVQPGATLTIDNSIGLGARTSHLYACGDMWDGIHISDPTSTLIITGSFSPFIKPKKVLIEDAMNAVLSENGGQYTISYATFNKNLIGIGVRNYAFTFPGTVKGSNFSCSTPITKNYNYTGSLYRGIEDPSGVETVYICDNVFGNRSWMGIAIENVGNSPYSSTPVPTPIGVTVGTTGIFNQNVFSNQEVGIQAAQSIVFVKNNTFTNCCAGIKSFDIVGFKYTGFGGVYVGVAGSITNRNTFTNCNWGVTVNGVDAQIYDNTFNTIAHNAIDIAYIKTYQPIVSNNTITRCSGTGVRFWDSFWFPSITIDNNTIDNSAISAVGIGIGITNANNDYVNILTDRLTISNNTTTNVNSGMLGIESSVLTINNNTFNVAPASGGFAYGIRLQNCWNAIVENNVARGTDEGDNNQFAIALEDCPEATVNENEAKTAGNAMYWKGVMNTSTLTCNSFAWATNGVVLDAIANPAAVIIGDPNAASDNVWTNNYPFTWHTFSISGTDGANIFWYTRSGTGIYFPSLNFAFGPGSTIIGSTGNLYTNAPANTICSAPCTSCIKRNIVPIAKDIVQYPFSPDENKWLDKNYAFGRLKIAPTLMAGNSPDDIALQNFYAAELQSNIGKLRLVKEKTANGDIADAITLNNQIMPQNNMEQHQKTVNGIYLDKISTGNTNFDAMQTQTLTSIAMQDVLDEGLAVYDARRMLNINKDIIVPQTGNGNRQLSPTNTLMDVANEEFRLYPNPNNGNMMLDYSLQDNDNGEIMIYDLTGKLITSYLLDNNNNQLTIKNEQLNNGIYFYHINVNNKIVKSDKLVIIK